MPTVDELLAAASQYSETAPDRARPLLNQALAASPFDPRIHALLGIVESDAKNLHEAARHLESATDLEPDNPRHWYDLGVVHLRLEHTEPARDCFEAALTRRTDYVDALNNLGICYAMTHDEIAACAAWARTIDLDPTGRRCEGAVAMVKGLAEATVLYRRPPRHGLRAQLRRFLRRSQPLNLLSPMQRYLDCTDALAESLVRGAEALMELLAGLHDESRAYWVVTEHLANTYFLLGQYEECYRLSAMAVAALPCVRSLVVQRWGHLPFVPGKNKDATLVYRRLMTRVASGPGLVMFTHQTHEGPSPDWRHASVACDDGIYEIRRGGNIFVITSPGGQQTEHQAYDRSDLVLGPF